MIVVFGCKPILTLNNGNRNRKMTLSIRCDVENAGMAFQSDGPG